MEEYTQERSPVQWATTQNYLGLALWRIGERESGTTRLEEAVVALHAALQERTRDRTPLQWAMTQSVLGFALVSLGERKEEPTVLEQALEAYDSALSILTSAGNNSYIDICRTGKERAVALLEQMRR